MNRQDFKKALIVAHDLVMTGVAILATFFVRFEGVLLKERLAEPAIVWMRDLIRAVANARRTLRAGFTTVRNLGLFVQTGGRLEIRPSLTAMIPM